MTTIETALDHFNRSGARALSNVELLQLITGNETTGKELHRHINMRTMSSVDGTEISEAITEYAVRAKGAETKRAAAVAAALEFGRRHYEPHQAPTIDCPEAAAKELNFIRDKKQEYFVLITLDGARRLINTRTITIGTLMSSLVHPREVFAPAIEDRAASIIIGHNHPSGMLDVSEQDREVTRRIKQVGDIIGIRLDDHIIVAGRDGYISAM